jgi:hypothetical protein
MSRLIAFVVAATLCAAGYAAPPTEESVNALLVATKTGRTLETMYRLMGQSMRRAMDLELQGKELTDAQKRVLDDMLAQFDTALREEMSWDKVRPMFVEIYRDTFTQEEVDGLLAFYRSKLGAVLIDKMPVVMQKSSAATQARLLPLINRMNTTMKKTIADLNAAK